MVFEEKIESSKQNSNFKKINEIDEVRSIALYLMSEFDVEDYVVASKMAGEVRSLGYTSSNVIKGIYNEEIRINIISNFILNDKKTNNYIEVKSEFLNDFRKLNEKKNTRGKTLVKTIDNK